MSTLKMDVRNLVYKLCEGREVPLLVTDIIAGFLARQDLFNINTLSRSLNAHANTIIYREIVVNLDGTERSVKKASLLFRTLLTSETAVQAVHTLSLAGDPLQSWRTELVRIANGESIEDPLRDRSPPPVYADLTVFSQGEIELYDNIATLSSASARASTSVWTLYLDLLRFAPHIHDFSASSDYFRFPGFRSNLQDMAQSSSIEKPRTYRLCLDLLKGRGRHASVIRDWDDTMLMLLAAPDTQSYTAVVSLKPESVRQLRPGRSSITRLDLHHYQIHRFDLNCLLAGTSRLKYLKYHATTDHGWNGSPCHRNATPEQRMGLEPLFQALHFVSDSLQELHTSHDFGEDSIHFYPDYAIGEDEPLFRQDGELLSLKGLQKLTISFVTLLGTTRNDDVWDWDKFLPSSLRYITLTDDLHDHGRDERWTDEELMPIISSLVKWLSDIERGTEAAELGLNLASLRSDFNEPVRQKLTRICEEHGVRCLIEKARADRRKSPMASIPRGRGGGNLIRGGGRGRGT